ncbi:hypothetical protein NLU13_7540 [Sarocladium strictum]|uniref:Distal membrane-arm assembly complex protein 1-like domain-containing protein n=1 Tax=Sarocladium strictum TaxID=5046 RepID=A0AA39GFC8_SARSR|nr:hypothetical protein NLU13_7540 [Sarocladium strictum]
MPSLSSLEKPDDVHKLLRKDGADDCLSCRVVGSGAFFGLAAYSYFSGMSQLERNQQTLLQKKTLFGMKSRKAGVIGISLGLAYLGLWRAIK